MPSSHLRMEEATSIIACKSIPNGFGRSELTDDLDDFVLEIDENEINNEIKANALVEDLAIDVLKHQRKDYEEEKVEKFKVSLPLSNGIDKAESVKLDENKQIQEKNNHLIKESNHLDKEIRNKSDVEDELDANVKSNNKDNYESPLLDGKIINSCNEDFKENDGVENKLTETIENIIPSEKNEVSEIIDTNESNKLVVKEATENTSNLSEIQESIVKDSIKQESELNSENFETIDNELDALLNEEQKPSSMKEELTLELMEVDPPIKEIMDENFELSSTSADVLDKVDSDEVISSPPDSPIIQMYPAQSLQDMDESSFREAIFRSKPKHQNNKEMKNSDAVQSEKRSKPDEEEEISNAQKKVKLDNLKTGLKKKLDLPTEPSVKKLKTDSDVESENDKVLKSENNASEEIRNGQASLDEIKKLREEIKERIVEMSPEEMKEVMEGRAKLFANYFEGKIDICLNRYVLEEMIMIQLIDFMAYKCEVGQLRQKCRLLESEQIRMNQMVYDLKRQAENAKVIIKRLIDEKVNNRSWTRSVIPLKVTRSVGLQVCTSGTMTVRKNLDRDRKSTRIERTYLRGNTVATRTSVIVNNIVKNKIGSVENKENISSNIEKDTAVSKDSSNDDVVIVSVTETSTSNKASPSTAAINTDKNVTLKKLLEVPKNGITLSDKAVRKPLSVEHVNSPQVPTKTPPAQSDIKTPIKENSMKKDPPKTKSDETEQNVAEIIDLTDKEDQPIIKQEPSSKSAPTATSSEQVITDQPKVISNSQLVNSSLISTVGIKKPPVSASSSVAKKPVDISAGADLVNSYDHLPKYPVSPKYPANVTKPPRPILRIGKNTSGKQGIMLSWSFEGGRNPPNIEEYQLYAFQESKVSEKVKTDTWKKVGDIKALPLPMACFLTQFVEGHKYHFIVRAVDTLKRLGDFSLPGSIILHAAGQTPSAS